ncbi:GNAT family N-acetyltransferase [Labedaea rhizosphaerae]|uniref:RimJ/RimL family protein N-acetyltransferase n=1 Tax=Labedaea rhizosphaerae TaxID=598644 RepID=A0A4R6RU96_LABRH|nr:GNAT family protein [Labedaea rhizosphaerae]TDP90482.1 RimJ/RimL family protein N-acetyltransferase [Labedaea rhizosphaerae]
MTTGKLVRLRPLEPSDTETVWRWGQDDEITQWLDADYDESLAQRRKRVDDRPRNSYEQVVFGIETLAEGKLIGITDLRDATPETGRAELDIWIGAKDHWNGGYGTDAVRTLCAYGFDVMRLHLIALWVVAENERARAAYRKVGFREEARHRECFRARDGRYHDMILMGLLDSDLIRG